MTKTFDLEIDPHEGEEFCLDGKLFICTKVADKVFPETTGVEKVKFTISNERFKGSRKVEISLDNFGCAGHHFGEFEKTSYHGYLFPALEEVAREFLPEEASSFKKFPVYFRLEVIE
jgi:hypothetical protein